MEVEQTRKEMNGVRMGRKENSMPIIRFTAEDIRNPADSKDLLVAMNDAANCYGEICGSYHEEDGEAIKPNPHSHLVLTGRNPDTTPRHYPISK